MVAHIWMAVCDGSAGNSLITRLLTKGEDCEAAHNYNKEEA
jgi:hypothetical protein